MTVKIQHIVALFCVTVASALAQFPAPPPTTYTAKMLETIRKNAADYASTDAEIRRRAILVLSKYKTHGDARAVLEKGLNDSNARVRQSALVSLIDGIPDYNTSMKLVPLMADPNVAIRRICSAGLPRLLMSIRLNAPRSMNQPPGVPSFPRRVVEIYKKAHGDTDATVRKNLIAVWGQVPDGVTPAVVSAYLSDSNRDVRISALDRGRTVVPLRQFVKTAAKLVNDSDRLVRLRLADVLGNYASFGDLKPLETLAKDSDNEVRTHALMGLVKGGRADAWKTLKQAISDRKLRSSEAVSAIELLPRLGGVGIRELKEFLDSDTAIFRATALRTLAMYQAQAVSNDALLAALKDESGEVRKAAGRILLNRPRLAASSAAALAASPHRDIREYALTAAQLAPRKTAESVLMDLFLDESETIRRGALQRYARLRLPGWGDLATDALEDDDYGIREQAVLSLLEGNGYPRSIDHPGLAALKTYLEKGTDAKLKTVIRSRMGLASPTELR